MAVESGTTVKEVSGVGKGSDIDIEIKRSVQYRLQAVLYERTNVAGPLTVEVRVKRGDRDYLLRQLQNFVNQDWAFVADIDFPPNCTINVKTIGAGGAEDHSMLVLIGD